MAQGHEGWVALLLSPPFMGLNPVDRAAALYQYALVLNLDEQSGDAKRAVLQSLELAPGYEDAQVLLLEIVDNEL